jgi:hypothetical protein
MNLSNVVTRIKLKLGLMNLATPVENLDETICTILKDITVPDFSIYCPYKDTMYMEMRDLNRIDKTTEYQKYLLPEFTARKLLYVFDVRYNSCRLSGLGSYADMPMMETGVLRQMLMSNAGMNLYNNIIPKITFKYEPPRTLYIYNAYTTTSIVLELGFEHDKSLASIPETARHSFMELALLDVKENLYPTMKQYVELNTALGTINLKIDDWQNAEADRKELLNKWDDTYHLDFQGQYYI